MVASTSSQPASVPACTASTGRSLTVDLLLVSANGGITLKAYELLVDDGLGGEFGPINETC